MFVILSVVFVNEGNWPGLISVCVVFAGGFVLLVKRHQRIKRQKDLSDLLVKLNHGELKRLSLELSTFPEGQEYVVNHHPYCNDLDLFGAHSIFQWLNRTVTKGGEQVLADALLNPASTEEIPKRQSAIKELGANPAWIQNFQANGLVHKGHQNGTETLVEWVNKTEKLPGWCLPALVIMPVVSIGMSLAYFSGAIIESMALLPLIVNGFLLSRINPIAKRTYDQTYHCISTLRSYEAMIACVEDSAFESKLLSQLRQPFVNSDQRASSSILRLKNILSKIETRHNFIYWIFNIYFLLDVIWLLQSERWKTRYRDNVQGWFDSLRQFEFLSSLGLTFFTQTDPTLPTLSDDPFVFKAEGLGHPLILEDERVSNTFMLEKRGTTVVLTGSNMSGKSTFLRTLGVNIVLARMGGTICAEAMQLGDFSLFTSMRTTDSIQQHVSSFYAELERIRQLIQLLGQSSPVMFLLDELLKGTNSQDRHLGSSALIKQLSDANAFGLISTHDLSLGKLADQLEQVVNFSFNCELTNGKLNFDYKLRPGVCVSFNAAELMSQMGIALD